MSMLSPMGVAAIGGRRDCRSYWLSSGFEPLAVGGGEFVVAADASFEVGVNRHGFDAAVF
jgi:hypothetical protein